MSRPDIFRVMDSCDHAFLTGIGSREPKPQPDFKEIGNSEVFKSMFVRDINKARPQGLVRILSASLNPKIYNDPRVVESVRQAYSRGVGIQVILGPWLVVDDNGKNAFLDLHREGVIDALLSQPDATLIDPHGRIVETQEGLSLFQEAIHGSAAYGDGDDNVGQYYADFSNNTGLEKERAEIERLKFDSMVANLKQQSFQPRLLRRGTLNALMITASAYSGASFDAMTPEDVEKYIPGARNILGEENRWIKRIAAQ